MLTLDDRWIDGLGFARRGARVWARGDLALQRQGPWLTLRGPATGGGLPDRCVEGPGLWKPAGRGAVAFDLPIGALLRRLDALDDVDDPADAARSSLSWALDTRRGGVPGGWAPPEPDRLGPVEGDGRLSFRAGPFLEHATLLRRPDRLALRVALCRVGALPAPREAWLQRLVEDAARLRMVRVALRPAGESRVLEASVDLTGAPAPIVPAVADVAVDALRLVFGQLVTTAAVIADPRCRSRALEARSVFQPLAQGEDTWS